MKYFPQYRLCFILFQFPVTVTVSPNNSAVLNISCDEFVSHSLIHVKCCFQSLLSVDLITPFVKTKLTALMLVKYYFILLDFLTFAGVQHVYDHQSLKLITQKKYTAGPDI